MRLLLSSALALGLGVVIATSLSGRATTTRHSDLLPDARVVRYRFDPKIAVDDSLDQVKAEALAQRSLVILRTPNPSLLVLAKLANARHDFRGAIALARESLDQKRTAAAYSVIATAQLAMGELASASEAAETVLALKPDSGAYLLHALVMQAQGRDAEAGFDFTRAATLEEHGAPAEAARLRALWGRFLMRRGDLAGAAKLYDEALRITPDHPLATALRGELALRTGKLRDAKRLFDHAFASSKHLRYLMDQARAQDLAGEDAGTLRTQIERLLRKEGVGHRLELVELLLDRGGDAKEALVLAREEVAARPSVDARLQLARALARTGAVDDALAQVRAALATGAREAQLYELAAQLERTRGNASRAALYAREAGELDPGGSGWRAMAVR
ncbi:MAG: tetratricopeptide repeat protein [Myxococcota bacterium]|nr:tetratricopeptide repeat protein [Deltaproteobacteria bacterium]MDQ3340087.1 tetratricopeptide repeat protein [Myxococcota bacterium]